MIAAQTREDALTPVALCGTGEATRLVEHLKSAGVTFAKDAKICLNIPDDFATRLNDGRSARVQILADLTSTATTVRKVESELRRYSTTLAQQRMIARGVAPSVTAPITVDVQSTNPVSRQSDVIARVLIIFFVSAPFFVTLAAAADMTAGERERKALEPLLAHPVGAFSIILGKWLAASAMGLFGVGACVAGGLALLDYSALPELGVRLETGWATSLHVLLLLTPLTLLVVALQLAIGLWARNFKDGQSYLTLLSFAPVVAGFAVSGERLAQVGVWPLAWELNALAVPLLKSTTPVVPFPQLAAIELALAFALLALCAQRLRSEAILSQG
jgi:sodium transport system permease protein